MSLRVLVIPEDPTDDQHVIEPVVRRLFDDLRTNARVDVLRDPKLSGIDEALNRDKVAEIVTDNPMIDLFLLVVDRDCERFGNTTKARSREEEHAGKLLTCLAVEEVEVWMLALHRNDPVLGASWSTIRAEGEECDPKERYAEPFLRAKGWNTNVGKGRKKAMRAIKGQWQGFSKVCPEVAELKDRVATWLAERP